MTHLSEQEMIAALEGELSPRADLHLQGCEACRDRRQELERALGAVVEMQAQVAVPSAVAPRAMLRSRLSEVRKGWWDWKAVAVTCAVVAGLGWVLTPSQTVLALATPDHRLTPGAAVFQSTSEICRQPKAKNKLVPVALQRRVFEEYGIRTAEGHAYEVDYLITPALGGADDIRNLWPQSYSHTVWNAQVKDALEDHLRDLVCEGTLDLATAQKEIATDWIEAYKKYFHTDHPL
jgi:hypothetical protein